MSGKIGRLGVCALFIMVLFAGLTLANPIGPSPSVTFYSFLQTLFLVFVMNLPINGSFYLLLLSICLSVKKNFYEEEKTVIKRALGIIIAATLFGAFVDFLVFFPKGPDLLLFGLLLIFSSYFFLIKNVQRIGWKSSLAISTLLLAMNAAFWFLEMEFRFDLIDNVLIIPISYLIFMVFIFRFKKWYGKRHVFQVEMIRDGVPDISSEAQKTI